MKASETAQEPVEAVDAQPADVLIARIRKLADQKADRPGRAPTQLAVQLPIWGDAQRGLPNSLARGALFTAVRDNSTKREYFEGQAVGALNGHILIYQGQELRQDDASVFMTLCHLARLLPLGQVIEFTAYSMLKELGWSLNTREYLHLRECLTRLSATNVTVRTMVGKQKLAYGGSLLRQFVWKDDNDIQLDQWRIWLEPELATLFAEHAYTVLEWGQRRMIGGRAALALWLHSFLCTHQEPYPISVARYHELSGSKSKNMFHFRARLQVALQRLQDLGFLLNFRIENGLVHVTRRRGGKLVAGKSLVA